MSQKTNLDSLFKTDQTLEKDGVWFEVAPGVRFKCRRFGGMNTQRVKAASAKYFKPFTRQIEAGSLDPVKEREITIKAFVESCVVDWEGVQSDDKTLPFSLENAVNLLIKLPDLTDLLIKCCGEMDQFKADLGNS